MADSLRVTRNIVGHKALSRDKPEEFKPGVQFQTDKELARLAGDIAITNGNTNSPTLMIAEKAARWIASGA